MHLDNSACNLACINLLKFLDRRRTARFDVEGFKHAVEVIFTGAGDPGRQRRLPDRGDRRDHAARFRQLGIGYANLGALLMALGLPYDSDEGRAWAGAITSLMTGHAYATSRPHRRAAWARSPATPTTQEHMLDVLRMHRGGRRRDRRGARARRHAHAAAQQCVGRGRRAGAAATACATRRPSVLAPTGTIGLMMDCDTTGIEPDLGLCKFKKLVGGGTMQIVNQTVPRALRQPRLHAEQVDEIVAYIDEHKYDPRRPAPGGRARAGVRLLDGRQHHPLHGPRAHDGRGAAVHLRRHLQDRQHARGGHGRRGRAAPHRRAGSSASRPSPSTATTARSPSRCRPTRRRPARRAETAGELAHRRCASASHVAGRPRPPRSTVADARASSPPGDYPTTGRARSSSASKQGSTLAGIMDAFAIAI